jgi:thiaminase
MLFDTERSIKAPDEKTYEELTKNIESNAGYARGVLSICTQDLQIPEGTVLGARNEWETSLYIEFLVNVATHFDWVASLVAMVPCIQVSTSTRIPANHPKDENSNCHSHTMRSRLI